MNYQETCYTGSRGVLSIMSFWNALLLVLLAGLAGALISLFLAIRQLSVERSVRKFREPSSFSGDPSSFKQWLFSVEESLSLVPSKDPVAFVSSYLEGNAKRWFMALCGDGKRPQSWDEFRSLLRAAFFPSHEKEQSRIALFRLRQTGSVQEYVNTFSSLSLASEDCDELTKTLLFVEGLSEHLRIPVRQTYPKSLQDAIRAAHTLSDGDRCFTASSPVAQLDTVRSRSRLGSSGLSPAERERLFRERRCFYCRKLGHIARDCKFPNGVRQ